MAVPGDKHAPPPAGEPGPELRPVADDGMVGSSAAQAEGQVVNEPTIRVPVPSPNWVVIVAATDTQVSAIELPIAAFTDPVLKRSLADMKYEMGKHAE